MKAKLDSQQVLNSLKDHKSLSTEEKSWVHSQSYFVKHTQTYSYEPENNTNHHLALARVLEVIHIEEQNRSVYISAKMILNQQILD